VNVTADDLHLRANISSVVNVVPVLPNCTDDFDGYLRRNFTDIGASLWQADCSWGEWLPWENCSVICGNGTQLRRRTQLPPKNNGFNCTELEGDFTEYQSCVGLRCPENCSWSSCSDWSNCSGPCGNQFQSRNRTQYGPFFGGSCTGNSIEVNPCRTFCSINLGNVLLNNSRHIDGNAYVNSLIQLPSNLSLTINGDLTVQESGGILLSSSNLTVDGNLNLLGNVSLYNSNIVVSGCVNISGDISIEKDSSVEVQIIIISNERCLSGRFQNVFVDGLPSCTQAVSHYTTTQYIISYENVDSCSGNISLSAIVGISVGGLVIIVVVFVLLVVFVHPLRKKIFPFEKKTNPTKTENKEYTS